MERFGWLEPQAAAVRWIERVHSAEYRQYVEEACLSGRRCVDFGETLVCEDSYEVALLSAGAALRAVDAVLVDGYTAAFSCARPPGHHARAESAMGFCLFNNVAIAACYAQEAHGVDRVCIVDWDVHHGNGTQEAFFNTPGVLFFSIHQSPLYPHTGEPYEQGSGAGAGLTLNVPMPPGSLGIDYREAFEDVLFPALESFRPGLILLSAGFDAHAADPLAQVELETADFAMLTRMLMDAARRYSNGRLVSVLEGGYHPQAMPDSVLAHLCALLEDIRA